MLKPKLFTTLQGYTFHQFSRDLLAGIIVGIVALPLGIAFAMASGVSPEKGLYTAIIAGFLISALGGSRVQIGGPTGAFVVIVYGIIQKYGLDGLAIATMMAGIILILLGVGRFGSLIKLIPHPVVIGFTSGIALIIFSSQLKDFLGLKMGTVPPDFLEQWVLYARHFHSIDMTTLGVGSISLFIILIWPKISRSIPGSLLALIVGTLITQYFHLPIETIGSRFGAITATFPTPHFPAVNLSIIKHLIQPATAIALLAGIESLLSAVVADGMIGGKHRSNMELIAQGTANIITPLFGGIPATGAIARTATNIKSGGRTPVSGMIHAIVLFLILLVFGSWATLIPLASLAAILIMVAYNMSEWSAFIALFRGPRTDVIVLLTTFSLTVIFDLSLAIEVGMVLSAFLFMQHMSQVTNVSSLTTTLADDEEKSELSDLEKRKLPRGVEVYEINGPFFFGAAYKFKETMTEVEKTPRVLIIRMRHVPVIDSTGLHVLKAVFHHYRKRHVIFMLAEVHSQPLTALKQSGLMDEIGKERIWLSFDKALETATAIIAPAPE